MDSLTTSIVCAVASRLKGNYHVTSNSAYVCWNNDSYIISFFTNPNSFVIEIKMGIPAFATEFEDEWDELSKKLEDIRSLSHNVFYKDNSNWCGLLDVWMTDVVEKDNCEVAIEKIVSAARLFEQICTTQLEIIKEKTKKGAA